MQIYWLEQDAAEVSDEADWLSAAELARLSSFHIAKRRRDWRLGRWTAKHAVAAYLKLASEPSTLAAIEIRSAASGAPEAFLDGYRARASISLSHRDGCAACAVASQEFTLGCDLEVVEPRCEAFVTDYFSLDEQQAIARAPGSERFRLLALLWSAKESALKALRTGLRMDVRSVWISFGEALTDANTLALGDSSCTAGWRPFTAHHPDGIFYGWYDCSGTFVRTIVSAPQCGPPMALQAGLVVSTPLAM